MDIEFENEPLYGNNDKNIKRKINFYGKKVNTSFQNTISLSRHEQVSLSGLRLYV